MLDQCPNRYCSDVAPAIELIDLFHDGMPPVVGGVLDQAAWFLDAARFMKSEDARIKSELMK